jgi:pterin-4a-carbinolamine dehydratase
VLLSRRSFIGASRPLPVGDHFLFVGLGAGAARPIADGDMPHYPHPYRPQLSLEQAQQLGWHRPDPNSLVRELRFRDFPDAFSFVRSLADRAVHYNRRPEFAVYEISRVRLKVYNVHHAGLTLGEVRLLELVEAVIDDA